MYLLEFSHGIHGDAAVRYDALQGFLKTGHLGPLIYSYVHPLISAPLLLLGYIVKDGFWWISRFNTFVFFGTLLFAAQCAKQWREWKGEHIRHLVLLLMGATMFPKHTTDYYAEVFSSCFILIGILLYLRGRSALAVLAICLSVWNTMATLIGGAALLLFFAVREKRWRYLAALPLLPAGICLENYLKWGEFLPAAYAAAQHGPQTPLFPYAIGPGFSYPLFIGLLNVFFSFGRGLLFFAPGLLAFFHPSLWKQEQDSDETKVVLWAGLSYLAGIILVYSKFWGWHGGAYWGPRFFLFASILAVYALHALSREKSLSIPWRSFWVLAVLLSCWVACQGVMFGSDFSENCYSQPEHMLEFMCFYTPEYSVLWRTFIMAPPITGRRVAYLVYFLLVAATLLSAPLRRLVREYGSMARALWASYGPHAKWRC